MNKLPRSRMIFFFVAIIIISVLTIVTSLTLFNNIKTLLVEEKGRKAMSISIVVSELIQQDYASFEQLLQSEDYQSGSYDAYYYARMQQVFRDIREKAGVKFLYCGKPVSENEMIYIFDGENPNSVLFSPLGSKDNLDEIERQIYHSKTSGYTPIVEDPEWGELLTGITPVINPASGEAVAHVGADVSLTSVHVALEEVKNAIMINALLFMIITSLIIYQLLSMAWIFTETDYLTGLRSKGYQDRFLEQQIKKSTSSGKQFPLIMIDFDDFKLINDEYGHQFGDTVLKSISEIIKVCTRSVDCSARYGGDEFIIILPEANLEYATLVCQWLLKEVSNLQLKTKNNVVVPVSISIGIALWEMGMAPDQILVHADKALYHSKRTGKNKIVVYGQEISSSPLS